MDNQIRTGMAVIAKLILFAMAAVSAAFLCPLAVGHEQSGNLELRFHPTSILRGVPQAFKFELVNVSGGDIRLPTPAIQCFFSDRGTIYLYVRFTPKSAIYSGGSGHGCGGGVYDGPPILERAKTWTILHPRQGLKVLASRDRLFYDDTPLGIYEFWAAHILPRINADERMMLHAEGIDFPQDELTTPHIRFVKSR